ncbi:MAG: SRPBCC family protein [Saprospiraceae bacterium]
MKELVFEQFMPITLDEAWKFFSTPANLNLITPDKMHFRILSEVPEKMYPGLRIRYKVNPMLNIPMDWTTEIGEIRVNEYFNDIQIKGPYKLWRHQHYFKAVKDGVMMTDRLTYDIGYGILGKLAGKLWVDKQVNEIFAHRRLKLIELFGNTAYK